MESERFKITIEAARVNAGFRSREKAANLIGVHKDTITNWETGKTLPGLKHIPAIEKVYKIPYDRIKFTT